jgi:anti-sigma factor RsiW
MTHLARGLGPAGFWRPRRRKVLSSCAEAQEAISARLDGERSPRSWASIDVHIAACEACAHFQADAVALGQRLGLRAAKKAPDDLVATLVSVSRPLAGPGLVGTAPRRGQRGLSFGHVPTARLAGATLPALAAVAAVYLGAGWHPRVVPTRPPSPCTAGLVAHHVPLGP